MLKIIKSICELNTDQLLLVYGETICKSGLDSYSEFSAEQQIRLAEIDLLNYLREDFFRQRDAFFAIWVAEGIYKSALRVENYRDGVLLHALETIPNARKMGYAFCLIVEVLAYLRQIGCKSVYSHIHKHNTASLRLHKKCGFQQISDWAVHIDGTITQNYCTMMIDLYKLEVTQ